VDWGSKILLPFPGAQIQRFDLFPGPGRSSQKLQARFDTGIILETLDIDAPAQFIPTVMLHEVDENHFQGYAVQGIFGLLFGHVFTFVV
jgi:hypothetical protein